MKKTPGERLKAFRLAAGFKSSAAFSSAHGLTESAYRHKENATREISVHDAKLYAKLLSQKGKVSVTWQQIIDGQEPPKEPLAALIGYVGAGDSVVPFEHEDIEALEYVPAPPGLDGAQCYEVRGASMLPVYRPGDKIFIGPSSTALSNAIGRDCLVQVSEGPRQIKSVRRGKKRGTFRLYSYGSDDETEDLRLDWAAPVSWVQRG